MAMVVQHNMQAANANRMLGVTTSSQAKSTEKLSSGYRINRAADDAAGLSISEKMRKQIRGLDKASSNAQDGISAVQTAEGALTEVHSMLQRMNELATQASNGTNSDTDRKAIQDEIDQLTTEIDRVSETTKFNETYLLKGNGETKTSKVNAHDAGLAGALTDNGDGTTTFKLSDALKVGDKVSIAGKDYNIGAGLNKDSYAVSTTLDTKTMKAGDSFTAGGVTKTITDNVGAAVVQADTTNLNKAVAANVITTADGKQYKFIAAGNDATADGWYDTSLTTKADRDKAKKTLADIAVDGSTITTANGTNKIVDSIGKLEVSSYGKAAADRTVTKYNGAALTAGDSVTLDGTTTNAVATGFTPTDFKDIKNAIQHLEGDKKVKISDIDGTGTKTYTVVESTDDADHDSTHLTRDEIIAKIKEGNQVTVDAATYTAAGVNTEDDTITVKDAYEKMANELKSASSIGADTEASVQNNGDGSFVITQGTVKTKDSLSFSLHVGADADMTNKISVDVEAMDSANLGIKGINVNDDSGIAGTYAIDAIADAISKVSSQRSALGAVQNRLEHTISNLDNVAENTTSAESAIRDTDMATEMVNYSKNNILAQAGQSMLAQANQSNQGVLSLLG